MDSDSGLQLGQIIKESGDFGRFQWFITIIGILLMLVLNWSMLTMVYTAAAPDFVCSGSLVADNITHNFTEMNVCSVNGTACQHTEFIKGMDTAVNQWDLICDKEWVSQTITTIQMSGLLVGGIFWGHVSDGIGRKPTMYINILILLVFNVISVFSVNWEMFAAMRFIIGFACTGFMSSSLSFEYVRNKWRVYLMLLPSWAICSSLMAGFAYLVQDWHYIHVVIAGVAAAGMFTWWVFPESFRWLVAVGRLDDAEKSLTFVAKFNGKPTPDLKRIRSVIEKEQKKAAETKALQIYSIIDLFKTRKIRKVTILFSLIWLFSSYSYYGIAFGVQELSGNLYLNMFLVSVVDIPGNILLVIFNTWGGRRWTCVGFYIVGGVFSLAVGVLQATDKDLSGALLNGLALTAKLFVSAAWEINTLWCMESFPTVVRNIGNGFVSAASRVGSMAAPQIVTLSKEVSGLLYLVSGVVCLVSSVLSVFLDETKNIDLPDMITPDVDDKRIKDKDAEANRVKTIN